MVSIPLRAWSRATTGRFLRMAAVALALVLASSLFAGATRASLPKNARERVSPHFVFYHAPDKTGDVEAVQLAAEEAYQTISDRLLFRPAERIPVIIYSRRSEFVENAKAGRTEFVVGTASSADHAIRLDGSDLLERPARVVPHEVAHIFLFRLLGDAVDELPLWMNEGLAQELGGADPRRAHFSVEAALNAGNLPSLQSLAKEFPQEAGIAYDQAQDAVNGLLEIGDWESMRSLLDALKEGKGFDAAMEDVYGFTAAEWDRRWLQSVRAEARKHAWVQIASWVVPLMMFIALGWGTLTVRRRRQKQIEEEAEPEPELEPPTWWREDEFRT